MTNKKALSFEERLISIQAVVERVSKLLERVLAEYGVERETQQRLTMSERKLAESERRRAEEVLKIASLTVERNNLRADLAYTIKSADKWHAEAKAAKTEVERLTRALELTEPDLLNIAEALAQKGADETSRKLHLAKNRIAELEKILAAHQSAYESNTPTAGVIDYVLTVIARHHDIHKSDLSENSRTKVIARARQEAWFILRAATSLSLPELGALLGSKNHTTVMYGIKVTQTRINANPDDYLWLLSLIYQLKPATLEKWKNEAPARSSGNMSLSSARATLKEYLGRTDLDRSDPKVHRQEQELRAEIKKMEHTAAAKDNP